MGVEMKEWASRVGVLDVERVGMASWTGAFPKWDEGRQHLWQQDRKPDLINFPLSPSPPQKKPTSGFIAFYHEPAILFFDH
jgi:hypothetical protein